MSATKDALADYHRKRDFSRTEEPRGRDGRAGDEPGFVVQIHDASTMHFDFRLEVDGVLKSWAVPKGPSADPHEKRLAMPTEDHPLEYREFEGVIAEGEYGGGTVIVWDEGSYSNLTVDRSGDEIPFADALRKGHVSFRLDGAKLHGGGAQRTHVEAGGPGGRWTGERRTMTGLPDRLPAARREQSAVLRRRLALRTELDGVRALAVPDGGRTHLMSSLMSSGGRSLEATYPEVVAVRDGRTLAFGSRVRVTPQPH